LCLFVLVLAAASSWGAVSASVDRDRLALGDTLRLTITATEDEELGDIDLQPLGADFEILRRSNSSKTSYINGKFSSTTELLLDMTPRRQGVLEIPPLRVGAESTNGLQLTVGPPPTGTAADQDLVFEAELDRSSVYVQGQVILTLRLQQAINLEDRNINQLELENAFVRPLEQNSFQRTIDGRPWLVHEIRYAIFPEHSGTLEIPAQRFSARESSPRRSLFDLGGGGRQVRRSTEPLSIEVLPRPASFPGSEWLPAGELTLEESWSTPPEQLRVGESATRTITIRGEGLQGAQLPPVLFPATEGLKYYPDQPVITDSESAAGLVGTRVDSAAVVPTRAGRWQIPELRIPWWDIHSNELRYAVLPGREIEVAGAEFAAANAAPVTAAASAPTQALDPGTGATIPIVARDDSRWRILSAVTATGWLLTLVYLVWSRRRRVAAPSQDESKPGEREAFNALLAACGSNDPRRAREAVLRWSAAVHARAGLTSLAQAAAAHHDPAMSAALESLNAALYGSRTGAWDGGSLAEAARGLRARHRSKVRREEPPLQLYPQAT
jgi:hypothetical protein